MRRPNLVARLRALEAKTGSAGQPDPVRVTITRHIVGEDLEAVQIVRRTFELYPEHAAKKKTGAR